MKQERHQRYEEMNISSNVKTGMLIAFSFENIHTGVIMLIFLSSLFIQEAAALSCEYGLTKSFPKNYSSGPLVLPSNFRGALWFAQTDTSSMSLSIENEAGESFDATTTELDHKGSEAIIAFSSEQAITGPHTLTINHDDFQEVIEIDVSEEEDITSPEAAVFVNVARDTVDDEWGGWDLIHIELEPSEEDVIYRVETSLNGTFDDAVVTYQLAYQNKVSLGRNYCDGNHTSQELNTLHNVRITAIDLAGNESQSTDVSIELEPNHGEPVEEGAPSKEGCSSTGTTGMSNLFSILLAGLAILSGRRRRSS